MSLITEPYNEQVKRWPRDGNHIMAHYDEETVVVYQAFSPEIADYAATYDLFDGAPGYSLDRMTWVKPNFLWMMHRSGWATKPGQEHILAIFLDRVGFDAILRKAVHAQYQPDLYTSEDSWRSMVSSSWVRLQWDPDYTPDDECLLRRAIQLGLRGKSMRHFANGGWIHHIEDVTDFVRAQHENRQRPYNNLLIPREHVYSIYSDETAHWLGVNVF
jgi:hypothetical protein